MLHTLVAATNIRVLVRLLRKAMLINICSMEATLINMCDTHGLTLFSERLFTNRR